jgi:hypothetical protein
MRGKKFDAYKYINQIFDDKSKYFKGDADDGSYFIWRRSVIQCIHKAALPIAEKIQQLQRVVDMKDDILKMMFTFNSYQPDVYRRLIITLEGNYGGDKRIYNYFRSSLVQGKKLNWNDLRSVQVLRTKIQRFIEHLRENNLQALGDSDLILTLIYHKKFPDNGYLIKKFRESGIHSGWQNPNSLEYMVDWLIQREVVLRHEKEHVDPFSEKSIKLRGTGTTRPFFKTRQTALEAIGEESSNDEADGEEEDCFPTKPSKQMIKRPVKRGDHMFNKNAKAKTFSVEAEVEEADVHNTDDIQLQEEDEAGDLSDCESIHCYVGGDSDFWHQDEEDLEFALVSQRLRLKVCEVCKRSRHVLHKCSDFSKLKASDRLKIVLKLKRCTNCLAPDHDFRQCPSTNRCRECKKNHHSLLHLGLVNPGNGGVTKSA